MLSEAEDQRLYHEAEAEITRAVATFEGYSLPNPEQPFDIVYADPPPQLQCQREQFLGELQAEQE